MTVERTPHSEVWTLFEAACNGTIDTEQTERLDAILHEDEQACDSYLLYMRMHAQLFRTFCLERCRDKVLQSIQAPHSTVSPAISDEENKQHAGSDSEIVPPPTFGVFSHILHGTVGFFSQEIPFSLLIATVLTALGLLAGSLVHVTHHQQLAHDASQSSGIFPSRTTAPSDLKYIGRVTGMANVQWADINTSTEKGNGVPLGRKYALAAGLMEITYDTGATVILQGPVTYEVDSRDGGFLSIGKLTARLEKKRSGVRGQGSSLPSPARGRGAGGEGGQQSARVVSGQQTVASGQWSVASEERPGVRGQGSSLPSPASGRGAGGEGGQQSEKVGSGQWPVASEERPGIRGQGSEPANQKSEIRNQKSLAPSPHPALTLTLSQREREPDTNPQSLIPNPSFAVRTPTATVTDLGTEFGVEVNEAGETDTQVFDGTVQIVSIGKPGIGISRTQLLRAGQYASVHKDRAVTTGKFDLQNPAKQFTRTMPKPTDPADAYAKLVLSMNPVVYYRMDQWPAAEGKNRYVLVDSAPGGHNGVACMDKAFGKPSSPGKFGSALNMHGIGSSDYAWVPNYPKAEKGQLSMSAWVWPVTLEPWVGFATNWYNSPQGKERGQFGFGIGGSNELMIQIQQQDYTKVAVMEQGRPLSRSTWHHVAFVADGAVLHLYHNGNEVGSAPYREIATEDLPPCLAIGCAMNKDGSGPRSGNAYQWNGQIDELAVFSHALSAAQVRQLYTGSQIKQTASEQSKKN